MSINNKRSYTEYTVTQPTTDFAIGFDDFDEGSKDNILVTLNGVLVESLGYAAIRKNESTVTITPAITEGTVRLTRETDIDEPFHKFTAGALFSAKSMDENFQQVRHSQQEVRDGFVFLEYNTNGIVEAAKVATTAALVAAEDVQEATTEANNAAASANVAAASVQAAVQASITATTEANTATATATTAASQATAATTSAQNAASAATVAKQEATNAADNANAATVDTLAAIGRANEAADVVADLVVGKIRGAVIYVNTIAELLALDTRALVDGQIIHLRGFHANSQPTNRTLIYSASEPRSGHGSLGWSPTVPPVSEQQGTTLNKRTLAFLEGQGETNPDGTGLFVFGGGHMMSTHDIGALPMSGDVTDILEFGNHHFKDFVIADGTYQVDLQNRPSGVGVSLAAETNLYWSNAKIKVLPNNLNRCHAFYNNRKKNVTLHNPVIVGDRHEHTGTTGEQGYLITSYSAENFTIHEPVLSEAWGDGYYMDGDGNGSAGSTTITGTARLFDCRRQGISIIHCERFTADTLVIDNIEGIAPSFGVDLEPNRSVENLKNIHIKNIIANNVAAALGISLQALDSSSEPVGIKVDYIYCNGRGGALEAQAHASGNAPTGMIEIGTIESFNATSTGIRALKWSSSAPKLHIRRAYIQDANQANYRYATDGAPVSILTLAGQLVGKKTGNIQIDSLKVVKTPAGASTLENDISITDFENGAIELISIKNVESEAKQVLAPASSGLVARSPTSIVTRWGHDALEIESGSNENGSWVKYPNGTLEMWHYLYLPDIGVASGKYQPLNGEAPLKWSTYPVEPVSGMAFASPFSGEKSVLTGNAILISANNGGYRLLYPDGITSGWGRGIRFRFIGRWK